MGIPEVWYAIVIMLGLFPSRSFTLYARSREEDVLRDPNLAAWT